LPHPGPAADSFLAPQLTLEAGYESNRFYLPAAVTNTGRAAFVRTTPAVNLHLLAGRGTELTLGASAARTDYLRDGFADRTEAVAQAEWWQTAAAGEGGLRLAGGQTRDAALSENDYRWLAATPTLRYTLPGTGWQVTAQAHLAVTDYDSRLTAAGAEQSDRTLEIRPGLRWVPTRNVAVWGEGYHERNRSNEDAFEYQGSGFAMGAAGWISPRGQLAANGQAGIRRFAGADERRDTPLRAELSYRHRLRPWLELFCSGLWWTTDSNVPTEDITGWSLQLGVTLAEDFEIFSTRP